MVYHQFWDNPNQKYEKESFYWKSSPHYLLCMPNDMLIGSNFSHSDSLLVFGLQKTTSKDFGS